MSKNLAISREVYGVVRNASSIGCAHARIVAPLAFILLVSAILPSFAQTESLKPNGDVTQDEVRDAVFNAGVKPLTEIIAIVRGQVAGDLVKIELKRKKHSWEYKIRVLTPQGIRRELKIDGQSGEILEID